MMEAEALRSAVEHAGLAAAGIGFLAGLAFGFNPVALASIPVSLAYVTKGRDKAEALFFGSMFILGMVLTHVVLGIIAGLGGKWAAEITGRAWGLLLGPLLIVLGLMWRDGFAFRYPHLAFEQRDRPPRGVPSFWGFHLPSPYAQCAHRPWSCCLALRQESARSCSGWFCCLHSLSAERSRLPSEHSP